MFNAYAVNTLHFNPELCTGCGKCVEVCPHAVYSIRDRVVKLVRREACMECGACQTNCPFNAIVVESGTGCAYLMFKEALKPKRLKIQPEVTRG